MSDSDILKLIEKIKNGDKAAENVLFAYYEKQIKQIVRSHLPSSTPKNDIQDIISDVRIALLKALRAGQYKPSQNPSLAAYIQGIVYNQIGQYFRKMGRKRETSLDDKKTDLVDKSNHLNNMVTNEEKKLLRKKLAGLKPLYQEILHLSFYENMSVEEIAKKLRLDKKKVIDAKYNALKKLAHCCKKIDFNSIFSILLQIYM